MKHNKLIKGILLLMLLILCSGCESFRGEEVDIGQEKIETSRGENEITNKEESSINSITENCKKNDKGDKKELTMNSTQEYMLTTDNIKTLGRTLYHNNRRWLSFSASGIEFEFTGRKCEVTLVGDSMANTNSGEGHQARYAIYVDDQLIVDDLLKEKEKTICIYEGEDVTKSVIRVVKLSESSDSSLGLEKITVLGGEIKPTKEKELKIEFIGDSITCGYGVDEKLGGTYQTSNENAVKAYAYKTAQALEADYSMVAMSGHGVISGYTSNGEINTSGLVMPYYNKIGKSQGKIPFSIAPQTVLWDFEQFTPNIVVVNLGTNDSSYCGSDVERCEDFALGYVDMLKQIREYNIDATILCVLGIMGDSLYPYVEKAVSIYKEEAFDDNVLCMKFDVQREEDGYGVDYHPSEITHENAANKLTEFIKDNIK